MTIHLVFSKQREVFNIHIIGKEVFYADRKMARVRLIPRDESINKLVLMSRNKIPPQIIDFFSLTKKEEEEYNNAQTEEELANICITDAKKNGASLLKRE